MGLARRLWSPPDRVLKVLEEFTRLPNVTMEDPDRVAWAFARTVQGMDFADALHPAGAEGCEAVATFDRDIAKRARATGDIAIRIL